MSMLPIPLVSCLFILPIVITRIAWAVLSPHEYIRIVEGTPAGSVLIPDLLDFLGRKPLETSRSDESPLLTIGNAAVPGVNWFMIDKKRRSLVVKTPPDRDLLCPSDTRLPETAIITEAGGVEFPHNNFNPEISIPTTQCVVKISIVHGSPVNPFFDVVSVILEDVNDHAPVFSVSQGHGGNIEPFVIKVPENNGLDKAHFIRKHYDQTFRVPLPVAKDLDFGKNNILGYRLEGQDAHFFQLEISPPLEFESVDEAVSDYNRNLRNKFLQASQLWLVPAMNHVTNPKSDVIKLDREEREEYTFVLVAYDGGVPQRSGRIPIKLIVEDVNDHAPMFTKPWYSGEITEGKQPGAKILEFAAYDLDKDPYNGRIGFRIPGTDQLNLERSTKQIVGYSTSQLLAGRLFAIDQRAETEQQSNRARPLGKQNVTEARLAIRLQTRDQLVETLREAIALAKQNPLATNAPTGNLFRAPFEETLKSIGGGLRLDFEIEAYDHGRPTSFSTRVPIFITIKEVNSKPPSIFVSYLQAGSSDNAVDLSSPNWGRVKENLAPAMVAQVTVIDEDDPSGQLDIFCNTDDNRFFLEEIPQTSYKRNRIRDAWTHNEASRHHQESETIGRKRRSRSAPPMRIYKLMLNTKLDREFDDRKPARIEFGIVCKDNAQGRLPGGQLSSKVDIHLLIEDVNDNTPKFLRSQYSFHIPENKPSPPSVMNARHSPAAKFLIGEVLANDLDEGLNAAVEYKLASNPSNSIELDPHSGQLFVIKPFDREVTTELNFQVLAIDGHNSADAVDKRLTGTAEVRLIIDDVNDSPPLFQEVNYHFEVEEGVDLVKVGQVTATDADQGEAARIVYRLDTGSEIMSPAINTKSGEVSKTSSYKFNDHLETNNYFQVDPISGIIRLKGRLDRERKSHYEFRVLAIDNPLARTSERSSQNAPMQFTSTATVLVTVLDKNDSPPHILSPRNHAEFILGPEQMIAGNTIFTIKADDPDLGENGTVEYELIQVNSDLNTWNPLHRKLEASNESKQAPTVLTGQNEPINSTPFALDRTAGICYLRENLPPLDAQASRSYLLHIRAYDLGHPIRLNSSLVVRVIRHSTGFVSSELDMNEYDLDAEKFTNDRSKELIGSWATSWHTKISDRSMVVILSAVFVLLLLTAVVLLLLVRYRRMFIRNHWVSGGGRSPNKEGVTIANDKLLEAKQYVNGSHGLFPQVLEAPWVNNASHSMENSIQFGYPTIYNRSTGSQLISDASCIQNPGACWSPLTTIRCISPPMNQSPLSETKSGRKVIHKYPPTDMEMIPRNMDECKTFRQNQNMTVGRIPQSAMIFENSTASQNKATYNKLMLDNPCESDDMFYYKMGTTLAKSKPLNFWPTSMLASQISQQNGANISMRRLALSLEDLTNSRESFTMKEAARDTPLVQINSPCTGQSCDDYQSLLIGKEINELSRSLGRMQKDTISQPRTPNVTRKPTIIHQRCRLTNQVSPEHTQESRRCIGEKLANALATSSAHPSESSTPSSTSMSKTRRKQNRLLRFANNSEPYEASNNVSALINPVVCSEACMFTDPMDHNSTNTGNAGQTSSLPGSPNKSTTEVCVLGSFV